jgi:hypothetical protein
MLIMIVDPIAGDDNVLRVGQSRKRAVPGTDRSLEGVWYEVVGLGYGLPVPEKHQRVSIEHHVPKVEIPYSPTQPHGTEGRGRGMLGQGFPKNSLTVLQEKAGLLEVSGFVRSQRKRQLVRPLGVNRSRHMPISSA